MCPTTGAINGTTWSCSIARSTSCSTCPRRPRTSSTPAAPRCGRRCAPGSRAPSVPQTDPGTLAFATFPHPDNEAAPSLDACGGTLGTSPPIADAQTYLRELPDPAATFLGSSSLGGSYILAAQTLLAYSDARPVSTVVFAHRAPNCTPDATPPELFTEVDASVAERAEVFAAVGLQTHVVALGLVEGQVLGGGPQGDALADHLAELDAIAAAGGTQAAIRAGDIAELDAAFAQIEQRTRSCRLELPPIAHGHSWYGVRIAGEDIDETFDCDEVPGFRWVDDGGDLDTIELCPVYCDLLERDPNPQIMPICVIVE